MRTTNGRVTNSSASSTAVLVYATLTPIGPFGPYSASRVRPATIVGSANGRSMTMLRSVLPGNESRTSTHAITVPTTAFTPTTASDSSSVILSAATACGSVIASQNALQPPWVERHVSAASGRRTIRVR